MKGNRAPAPPIHTILKLRNPPANAAGRETQPVRDSGRHNTPTAQALLLRVERMRRRTRMTNRVFSIFLLNFAILKLNFDELFSEFR